MQALLFDLTSSSEDSPVKTFRWLDDALAFLESEADCFSSSCESLLSSLPVAFSSKTWLDCYPAADVHSAASWPIDYESTLSESEKATRWQEIADAASAASGKSYTKLIQDAISASSSPRWRSWVLGSPCAYLTLNGSAFHSGASASSLLDILEPASEVPAKYYLSAKACRGILRRAAKRGRDLPPVLREALQMAAESGTPDEDEKTT